MNALSLVTRADELLEMGRAVLATAYSTGGQYNINYVNSAPMAGFRSAALSFIERTFGKDHPHFQQFTAQARDDFRSSAEDGFAILEAIRHEIAGGWLFTGKGLVASELFADFITGLQRWTPSTSPCCKACSAAIRRASGTFPSRGPTRPNC